MWFLLRKEKRELWHLLGKQDRESAENVHHNCRANAERWVSSPQLLFQAVLWLKFPLKLRIPRINVNVEKMRKKLLMGVVSFSAHTP